MRRPRSPGPWRTGSSTDRRSVGSPRCLARRREEVETPRCEAAPGRVLRMSVVVGLEAHRRADAALAPVRTLEQLDLAPLEPPAVRVAHELVDVPTGGS